MKRLYVPSEQQWDNYYTKQIGGGGLPFYSGRRIQRGRGLGGIFRKVLRFAAPLARPILREIGHQAIGVAHDVISGQSFKSAAKQGINRGVKRLADQALNQSGAGATRKRRRKSTNCKPKRNNKRKNNSSSNKRQPPSKKRKKSIAARFGDLFDDY